MVSPDLTRGLTFEASDLDRLRVAPHPAPLFLVRLIELWEKGPRGVSKRTARKRATTAQEEVSMGGNHSSLGVIGCNDPEDLWHL